MGARARDSRHSAIQREPPEPARYADDPHLDPQLGWAGKAEHTSFEVPTVSRHVHDRIEPRTLTEAARITL